MININIVDNNDEISCSWCKCPKSDHVSYWECPLLGNKIICNSCCLEEMQNCYKEIVPDMNEKEVIKICCECNRGGKGETDEC